ncbi:hypothetical protein GW17_00006584 [Ensete ventricosum]|nr:hypothetical protein GW17_00006584 [Ensete ventricosum]
MNLLEILSGRYFFIVCDGWNPKRMRISLFCFRNYVVQYIVDMNNPLASAKLVSQFEGKYVQLSIQKFSSNVVEKCLRVFGEDAQATIITELLSVSHFEQLLQDPFANYVIRSALENSKVLCLNQFR